MTTWKELKTIAVKKLSKIDSNKEYLDRLRYEFGQIEMQGAGDYWIDQFITGKKTSTNRNGLVLPLLLGMTEVDPIAAKIPHSIQYHQDYPDIDIDFLPTARDQVKKYAADKYGHDKVCSVGLWQRFKPKLALTDTCRVLGIDLTEIQKLTKTLPDEFDDMDFEEACNTYPEFKQWADANENVTRLAYRLVKLIKAQGRHAGGLIISSVPIRDHIPLTRSHDHWTSAWTEGRSMQLSKFGFVKFDILGLTNLLHIWNCKKLIKENRDVTIDWSDMDPELDRAGWEILPDGTKSPISFKDKPTITAAHKRKVDTIFQFETELAKSILQKGGVKSFRDLVIYTSLGRPGPLPLVDEYVARRDGKSKEQQNEDPRIMEMFKDTYGIIVFQEQLARFFVQICGFTIPEAEAARKAVAKKWEEELAKLKDKTIAGATRTIGRDRAIFWWGRIESFARYCFNQSHAIAYIIISYRCLWLKTHYPAEWWASVMSNCKHEKLIKYMGIAKSEGVKFGALNFNDLHKQFHVNGDLVVVGLGSIKGIGDSAANDYSGQRTCKSIDEFVTATGKNKIVFQRMIRLGAFDSVHKNRKALWHWYLYKHGTCAEAKAIKQEVDNKLTPDANVIAKQREQKKNDYFSLYPKRKKLPKKIENWNPKVVATLQQLEEIYDDYTLLEKLEFEKEHLGYYWTSPLSLYLYKGECQISDAKHRGVLEAVIESVEVRRSSNGQFLQLTVNDGIENARVMVWYSEMEINDESMFKPMVGLRMRVAWRDQYSSFSIKSGSIVIPLEINSHVVTN
jgi:DNA polymerase-3 subunit alpha